LVKISKNAVLLLGLVFIASLSAFNLPANDSQPTGYDLAAAVNAYRAANGYYQLNPHPLVMAAAQTHAEWIVATGQGGHIGANGSNETIRVSWTGYGGGANIRCDECWASGRTIDDAIYSAWSDWTHQEVMLNAWGNRYTDIGGGVASQGNGRYVFVLDVCKIVGKGYGGAVPDGSGSVPSVTTNPLATADLSNYVYGVTRATALPDGTIKHRVMYGQTLVTIAKAYGITIDALRSLNNMAADATIIWPEQELLIQPGSGTPKVQESAMPDTKISPSPSATVTIQARTPLPTLDMTPLSITVTPQALTAAPNNTQPIKILGMLMIAVSGVGLVVLLFFSIFRK
jgi:LysM repeat protein